MGDVEQVFKEKAAILSKINGIGNHVLKHLNDIKNIELAEQELKYIQDNNITAPKDDNLNSQYTPPIITQLALADTHINSVVWATGFNMRFEWIQLPVLQANGYPEQTRGITQVPGCYFLGLNWMHISVQKYVIVITLIP